MKRRDHIIPLLSTSIIPFSQSFLDSLHESSIHLRLFLFTDIPYSTQIIELGLLWGLTDFQCELETIEGLTGIAVRHVR